MIRRGGPSDRGHSDRRYGRGGHRPGGDGLCGAGGADFGGGIWDLLAGGAEAGREVRHRIDRSITPVWESNHVWLIIAIVVLWTGFPVAFADVFTTLFVPLSVAGLGIVLRGCAFAFRAQVRSLRWQTVTGGVFALSSLLTPFFLGTVVGAVVTGQVRGTSGDPVGSWTNLTSLLTGGLFVVTGAYPRRRLPRRRLRTRWGRGAAHLLRPAGGGGRGRRGRAGRDHDGGATYYCQAFVHRTHRWARTAAGGHLGSGRGGGAGRAAVRRDASGPAGGGAGGRGRHLGLGDQPVPAPAAAPADHCPGGGAVGDAGNRAGGGRDHRAAGHTVVRPAVRTRPVRKASRSQ